ncbi:uncharacterized protein LOC143246504 [Tachypleus tridentatus]|uniref:uncharacterized protein LOC143246504 n=1 Tax=Tachypleus tridentatus TaxID=6853 RepID=UPI003FD10671
MKFLVGTCASYLGFRGYITSTIFFVSDLGTLIQSTFGIRLPIIQGPSSTLLTPIFASLSLPQ